MRRRTTGAASLLRSNQKQPARGLARYVAPMRTATALLLLAVAACGSEGVTEPDEPLPAAECEAGQYALGDGRCILAGVPLDGCGAGFAPSDDGGCSAVLPLEPCLPGTMALPGEVQCREVAACGDGPWGNITLEAGAQFVDQNFAGSNSDGSQAAPWTTIGEALVAAAPGAMIAITDGVYAEGVDIAFKHVRLWGRCPARVELVGTLPPFGPILVRDPEASGTEIHWLAIHGPSTGVALSGSEDVLLEGVWIHDTSGHGIVAEDDLGPTGVILRDSLIERVGEAGIGAVGSQVAVERSIIRDVQSLPGEASGVGVTLKRSDPGTASTMVMTASLVERCLATAIFGEGASVSISESLIRDTFSESGTNVRGRGIEVNSNDGVPPNLEMARSVVERNREGGILIIGGTATLDAITVRDTAPTSDGFGRGLFVQDEHPQSASAVVTSSTFSRNEEVGIFATSSDLTLDGVLVRDTQAQTSEFAGRGIIIQPNVEIAGTAQSTGTFRRCVVEGNRDVGIHVASSRAWIEDSLVRNTMATAGGLFGDGITSVALGESWPPSEVTIVGSLVKDSARAGVSAFGSKVALASSSFDCNAIHLNQQAHSGQEPSFTNDGQSTCGCDGQIVDCKVFATQIAPPEAIE
jgi:Right handed beta helix region